MAFERPIPHPFTANGVQRYAPTAPGVYGMSNARQWIYIGQSENIQGALLEHLRVLDTAVLKWEPTGFVFEACSGEHRQTRQNSLILEYTPICNRRLARRPRHRLGQETSNSPNKDHYVSRKPAENQQKTKMRECEATKRMKIASDIAFSLATVAGGMVTR